MKAEIDKYGALTIEPYRPGDNFTLAVWAERYLAGNAELYIEFDSVDDGPQRVIIRPNRPVVTVIP